MKTIFNFISNDKEMSKNTQKVLSIIFLLIACSMAMFEYTEINNYWFDSTLEIRPDIISTFIAIFLIAPLYMRNILKWNRSIYTLITLFLFVLLFSSLIELALGGGEFKGGVVQYLVIASLLLSWLGMKAIAGISWVLLIFAVVYAQMQNSIAMGFYGFLYLTTGFISLVLHSELSPGNLVNGIKEEFSISDNKLNEVKNSINASIN